MKPKGSCSNQESPVPEQKNPEKHPRVFSSCPHCGRELTLWEQVLLGVDRALVCKRCWYRIILTAPEQGRESTPGTHSQPKDRGV